MKKLHTHLEFSNKQCKACEKPIKKNVLRLKPLADLCYVCFMISKGRTFLLKKEGRLGGRRLISPRAEKRIVLVDKQAEQIIQYKHGNT